jgi:molybdate transport system regulatory protein
LAGRRLLANIRGDMKSKSARILSVQPRLRVGFGNNIALGPGKVELLRRVQETRSISAAARQMEMSYMRAWSLIQTMNRCFGEPVIITTRGGQSGGGAKLTKTGRQALALYQKMERDCLRASKGSWRKLQRLLRD